MAKTMKRLPPLPAERALKVIAGRWKAIVLYHLFSGPKRLSELTRLLPSVSQKVLIQQLREMEEHGLVHREIFRQVPPRVDYSVTALGLSLEPVILSLCEWGRRHAAQLNELDRLGDSASPRPQRTLDRSPRIPGSAMALNRSGVGRQPRRSLAQRRR
jgi:DNA-binding HxlR family transcriptional regulator